MKMFSKFKKFIACAILVAFIPSQAWAQGIVVPSGSSLNVSTGRLTVPGDITNAGTLSATTGAINVSGNWTNSGIFSAGTSTVSFYAASGTQTINSGGVGATDAFYNLTHNAAGTVQLVSNGVLINNNFTNTAGSLNANNLNMTVDGNWQNTASFIPGTNTVTLGGANGTTQDVLGSTTFYTFSKVNTAAATLTFDHTGTQTFTNSLTMQGVSGGQLVINSDSSGHAAAIALSATGMQSISFVNVKDSNAGTPPTQQTLVARATSTNSGNNTNWDFGGAAIAWTGTVSSEWNNPLNWNPLVVPTSTDTVTIPPVSGTVTYDPNLCPSGHVYSCVAANVGSLTIQSGASLTLSGQNLTIGINGSGTFNNNGNVILEGNETLTLTMDSTHGTFTYVGEGGNSPVNLPISICTTSCSPNVSFNNLVIDDPNPVTADRDVFAINGALAVNDSLTVTSGTLDASASGASIADSGSVTIGSAGILKAPSSTSSTAFTVAGNWNDSGTFNADNGLVTFNGGNQTVLGSTTFYQFTKSVTSPETLTFDATSNALQTFTNYLTLTGSSATNLLTINTNIPSTQAYIALTNGGNQTISDVDVFYSNASKGVLLVARNNSVDGPPTGTNTNWAFGGITVTWTGATSTNWDTPSNWSTGVVPQPGDVVIIPGAPTNQPVLTSAVSVGKLTIQSGASLTLSGNNLTVNTGAGNFVNDGNLILDGTETVSLTQDTNPSDQGTFTYVGNGTTSVIPIISFGSPDYYNLVLNGTNTFQTTTNITTTGNVTVTSGTLDISTHSNTLTVGGALTLGGSSSVLTAANSNIAVAGSVSIASGDTFTAPAAGSFSVGASFTNNAGNYVPITHPTGFNNSSGTVVLTTTTPAVITGDTVFYNLVSTAAGKNIHVAAGSTQTVTHNFIIQGTQGNLITLSSTSLTTPWNLALSNTQSEVGVNVEGSDATNTVLCLDCVDSHNNTNWVFETLSIISPAVGTTVGQTPTILGQASPNIIVYIRDISGNLVATTKSDIYGNFRVVVGQDAANTKLAITSQLATGANSLTPYLTSSLTSPGYTNNVTVTPSPTTSQVPVITQLNGHTIVNPSSTQFITGSTPTIAGKGAAGQVVTGQALDASGNLIETTTLGTVAGNGTYSVTWPSAAPLPSATNYLSITVGTSSNETTSALIQVSLTVPSGIVYNSVTNQPIQGAAVTLYDATTKQVAAVQSCNSAGTCCDMSGNCCTSGVCTSGNPPGNPLTTLSDGFYGFLAPAGQYYINVAAPGYTYPSVQSTVPSGRSVSAGSKGQTFTVGSQVFELDQPMDGNNTLLHITKTANKSEAHVGDIVMYTVNIQNLSSVNAVNNAYLSDKIPPGFKYIKDRVILNGSPISEPAGQRPVVFNVGTVPAATTVVLQYQLVIGSGVTMGTYQNTATAQYIGGIIISNPAEASVKIIPDTLFDMGTVIGKVFYDWNENGIQDAPYYDSVSHETTVEGPVPNVQIVMEDGTVITTDRNGQYNIPGLLPGRHLFRLDERTLPPGAYLTTDKAVIMDVTAGSIAKVNFGVNIDRNKVSGRDAVYFNEKLRLTQDRNRPVPRLNAALFNASANAKPKTEEVLIYEGAVVRQAEFRIFTNYSPFISSWRLDIMDADTKKLIKSFEGTPLNINDPIFWNGRDNQDVLISTDHNYSYVASVADDKNNRDDIKEKPITIREIKDEDTLKKEREETKDVLKDRADRYRKWLDAQVTINNLDHQLIPVKGETIHIDRQGTDVKTLHIMKGNQLFLDLPLTQQYGLTPDELMAGGFSSNDEKDNLEVILPNGGYTMDVVSIKPVDDSSVAKPSAPLAQTVPPLSSGVPSRTVSLTPPGTLEHYSRPLQIGDDYILFVALGDAQVGYNIDRGNIEPIQDSTQQPGFYKEGKGAYYLKGQILGKYLITSSFDSNRQQKALFRQLDPNTYYPVYGDKSSINYDAADTQGPLYLKVEWDKSSAILGNYAIDFNDTEFAAFSRTFYGGKIDYQSVANNSYGDARTKIVVYHAQIQQLPSHNEFLATGGSLYFLKYKNVVQGSDTITIQVRDQTTGLVLASQTMTNGADYELDNSEGRILFWQPVAMIAQSESIISNNLINGNPIYVVVDYQYAVTGMQLQGSQGARIAQAVGDNVVLGGTFIQDNSGGQNYTLQGTDATLHVNKDTTVKAEYAQTSSQETGSYVSTDGGITFTSLMLNSSVSGKAYGIKGDTRLFDNVGLKTYYKWIGNDFGATDATSQQGKEMMGLSMTFDLTPVTRLTASEDIQRLMAGGNLQTSAQVGASETDTTMVQIVHTQERLKLTGQFQLTEVKSVVNGIESTTNQRGATMAGQAQYDLTDRIKVTLGQQVDVMDKNNTATTLGIAARATDHMTLNAQEVFSQQGHALTAGVTNQLTPKIALTTDYTLTNLNTGEVDKTASVMVSDQISKNITTTGTVAQTASSTGANTTTASIGTKAKISDNMSMDLSVGKSQNSMGQVQGGTSVNLNGTTQMGNTTITGTASGGINGGAGSSVSDALGIGTTGVTTTSSFGVQATTKVDNNNTTNGSLNVANESTGAKTTTFGFGNTSQIDQALQAVTNNSFSFSPDNGTTNSSKYGLVRNVNGQKAEASYTQQSAVLPTSVSQSNIYGLSGDVNDKLALNGNVESGKVQNLDGTQTKRTDFTLGAGYVLKDTETAVESLKNSLKLELRLDKGVGTDTLHQYVLYDAIEGKITDNWSVNAKVDYSKTLDVTTGAVAERHQEIILGMAYRPVNFDKLNLITEYSYQSGYGGGTQQADALNTNVNQTIAQVFSAEAVYDINDQWQLAEKAALRIESEQDTGFAFTQTHTWLVINRLNYKIDRNWTISGEYRDLAQVEAKDNKQGILLEATRDINANTQLAIGWNFTSYSDDLTNLSYTSLGPFVRMTGKFYDETPEERARARAKWLDARIDQWAWAMIRKEFSKKDSKIVLELNRMFALAKQVRRQGHLEEARQIYKDIITAGQMMYNEASEYIRGRIAFEEQLQQLYKTGRDYFKGGEYVKARKIWEKVVEDASKGVVK